MHYPEIVRSVLGSPKKLFQVGDDMTRSFDTLLDEADLALVRALSRFEFVMEDILRSSNDHCLYLTLGMQHPAQEVPERNDKVLSEIYREWEDLVRQLSGRGAMESDFIGLWMAILKDLAEGMWLAKRPDPRSCGVPLGLQCDCCGPFTPDQKKAITCVSAHMNMLYMAVLLGNTHLVEQVVTRLRRLWPRVAHYLETEADNPAKADAPPSYADSQQQQHCLLESS